MLIVIDGLKTPSPLNGSHRHWSVTHSLRKRQRWRVALEWKLQCGPRQLPDRARVKLTRLSPGSLDDDNLRGALKTVRDQVADQLGIDDRAPIWDYDQRRSKGYGVEIEIG